MQWNSLRRPSPAMIVAIVALVMAMAGTGYAAFKLPKNSVGSKQIKKSSVTGAKVKNQSLTGKDIKLKKLGTVPSATNAAHATVADSANAIPPAEATHLVGAPGQPPFQSGSSSSPGELGVQFPPVGFYKDHEGIVHLQGVAKVGGVGTFGVIFSLPPGYRPASNTIMLVNAFCFAEGGLCTTDSDEDEQTYSRLLVAGSSTSLEGTQLDGDVIAPQKSSVSLDGISFRAES
jgi:hypothetical protein